MCRPIRFSKTGLRAACLALTLLLPLLAGCAGSANKVEPAPLVPSPSAPWTPSVARLEGAAEGFLIMEASPMDEGLRKDFDRAVALLKDKDYGGAVAVLEKIIERSPGVAAPYIDAAIAYRQIGKPEQAETRLKTALQLVPGHPVACNEYGLLFRQTGRFAEAKDIYERAIARFPDFYPVHRNLGILCDLYLNDPACALEHYEIYSAMRPEDKQVKLWIADLHMRLGK